MVVRTYARCRACGAITLLRVQVGWTDEMPLTFGCPCGSVIRGTLTLNQRKVTAKLDLHNAEQLYGDVTEFAQEIQCSGELPVPIVDSSDVNGPMFSPYMRFATHVGPEVLGECRDRMTLLIKLWREQKEDYRVALSLFLSANYPLCSRYLCEHFGQTSEDESFETALSGLLGVMNSFLELLLPPRAAYRLREFLLPISDRNQRRQLARAHLADTLDSEFGLLKLLAEGMQLLDAFLEHHGQFLSVLSLSHLSQDVQVLWGGKYRVTTVDFPPLKQLYAECYEWIGRLLVVVVALDNFITRGNAETMHPSIPSNAQTLQKFHYLSNGAKRGILSCSDWIGSYLDGVFDNRIRNAINHYKTSIDYMNQVITYYPYTDPNRADRSQSIFLIDFVNLTYRQAEKVRQGVALLSLLLRNR